MILFFLWSPFQMFITVLYVSVQLTKKTCVSCALLFSLVSVLLTLVFCSCDLFL